MHKELSSKKEGLINEFIDEALAFNKKHNIFIRANKEEVLEKDILDCMPLVERIKTKEKILDLGSGGGFPWNSARNSKTRMPNTFIRKEPKKMLFFEQNKRRARTRKI
jgi:16S rRNA G527 N7-methylase RsmG